MSNVRSRLPAYGRIPKTLLRDAGISPAAKTVYAIIDEVAGHETITIERLALWLGVNVKTARKHLHTLRDEGWIEVVEVFEPVRGQVASEYIANAYPFQGDDSGQEKSSDDQRPDQGGHQDEGADSSEQVEESGRAPSTKDAQNADRRTGVQESGRPLDSQKGAGPTSYGETNETPPPTSSTADASSDGFAEFWAAYPPSPWKGRKEECRQVWLSLTVQERRDTWRALTAYKNSWMWHEHGAGSPLTWLNNDPYLEYRTGNLPPAKPKPPRMLTPDDVRLSND